jgi:NAD(P)-dependent dehydrogenase (short-subunit alcohol dehydrogenase family)
MNTEKVWFVTGSAKGLGFEIVKAALEAGHKVAATIRSRPEELATSLQNHPGLLVVQMDVTDEGQVKTAVAQAIAHLGRIDVLVNNAGYGLLSGIEEASDAEVREQYDTNVFGLLNVTRAVLPHMRRQQTGHVINISSLFGFGILLGWGIYSFTKFAVEGITEALAAEIAPLGLFATSVEPGLFRTNFWTRSPTSPPPIPSRTTRRPWAG